jgi:hypothetical protein
MKLVKTLVAAAAIGSAFGAQALVVGTLGGGAGTFATISGPPVMNGGGTLTGSVTGTIVGGEVFPSSTNFADDVVPGENFLAAGPTAGNPAVLTLTGPSVTYISFLWGSPDLYNTLTVTSTDGSQTFKADGTGFPTAFAFKNGEKFANQAVQFASVGSTHIVSLTFDSKPTDAFEVGHFTTTSPVPEPETYALMLAGLGVVGFIQYRGGSAATHRPGTYLTRFSAGLRRGGGAVGGGSWGDVESDAELAGATGLVSARLMPRGGVTVSERSLDEPDVWPVASDGIGNAMPWPFSRA